MCTQSVDGIKICRGQYAQCVCACGCVCMWVGACVRVCVRACIHVCVYREPVFGKLKEIKNGSIGRLISKSTVGDSPSIKMVILD